MDILPTHTGLWGCFGCFTALLLQNFGVISRAENQRLQNLSARRRVRAVKKCHPTCINSRLANLALESTSMQPSTLHMSTSSSSAFRSSSSSSSLSSTSSLMEAKRRPPMSRELYQRTMLMPIVELSKHKHQLSPLHQSKVKHHYRLSKEERLWKPTNGMVLKTQGQRRQRRQRLKTVPRLNRSWVQSFELESSLFASPAIWGTTKLTEVLQLCGGTQEHAAPARMKSIVAIEISRQLRDQFGTGSSSSNMHLFRTLASALFPGISPVESSKTLSTNAVIYTHCMVCKIQCNTFNVCHCCTRDTLIKTCYCSECTELLKLCPSCFEPIEMGQHSTRLNLEPKTKQLELVAHTTKNLELFTINHWVQLRSWYDHEHLLIQEINETQARRQEIVAFNQHNLEEKLKGIRVLEKSTKAWQISILGLVFRRWADCLKKLKASAARMTKFFQQLKGTNMKLVMREWSSVVQRLKLEPELSRSEQMDQRIKECTKEIAKRSERIEFLT